MDCGIDGTPVVRSESVTDLAAELSHGSRVRSSLPGSGKFSNLVGSASSNSLGSGHNNEVSGNGDSTSGTVVPTTSQKPFGLGTFAPSCFNFEFDATSPPPLVAISSTEFFFLLLFHVARDHFFWSWFYFIPVLESF